MTKIPQTGTPTLRLAFMILAHDQPAQAAELARTLVAAGHDITAFVHYLDAGGEIVTQADSRPLAGRFPKAPTADA